MLTTVARNLDIFRFTPRVGHIDGYQKSRVGFIGTLILLGIMFFYAIFTIVVFITDPPTTSVTQSPTSDENLTMVETCVRLPMIANKSWFGYSFQRIHNNVNQSSTSKIDLDLEIKSEDEICLPANSLDGYLNSFCKVGNECDYLKFKLYLCGSDDYKNPAHYNDSSKCMPFSDLVHVLETNYVTFEYKTHLGGVLWNMPAKVNTSVQLFSTFNMNETRTAPDLLRWWKMRKQFNLQHSSDNFVIQYYFGEKYPDREVVELQLKLDSESLLTVESRKTSLDVLGQIGALGSLLFSGLGLIFMTYNEIKFFRKNPSWNNRDANFRLIVVPSSGSDNDDENNDDETNEYFSRKKKNAHFSNNDNNSIQIGNEDEESLLYSRDNSLNKSTRAVQISPTTNRRTGNKQRKGNERKNDTDDEEDLIVDLAILKRNRNSNNNNFSDKSSLSSSASSPRSPRRTKILNNDDEDEERRTKSKRRRQQKIAVPAIYEHI